MLHYYWFDDIKQVTFCLSLLVDPPSPQEAGPKTNI